MKKYLIILLILISTYLFSQELNFRGFKFGADINKIIEKEGNPDEKLNSNEKNIIGDINIHYNNKEAAGYSVEMEIEFKDNKMIAGGYSFKLEQKDLLYGIYDPKNFVNAYNDLIRKLTKLYKTPKRTNEIENIDNGISALLAKSIANSAPYDTLWEIDNGAILLMLNYKEKWSLSLLYISPEQYKKMQEEHNNIEGL